MFSFWQAVQCARLGVDVSMCGSVGDDSLGEEYRQQFRSEGVSTEFLTESKGVSTGIASINVETTTGANTIVVVGGANGNVNLNLDNIEHQSLIEHIKSSRVLICQNEIPLSSTLSALKIARAGATLSIFNPAPASQNLIELISESDIVCPNETELSTLTSLPTNTEEEIIAAANCLLSFGCKVIIVTLGERGAYLATKQSNVFIKTQSTVAVDSTGAGDSFIGEYHLFLNLFVPLASILSHSLS